MRRALPYLLLAAAAVLSFAVGYATTSAVEPTGDRTAFHYRQRVYNRPRIAQTSTGRNLLLEHLSYTAHGGEVEVEWYDGAVTPLQSRTGLYVALFVDGRREGATLYGGLRGAYEARPGWLVWSGNLTAGRHAIDIRAVRTDTGWAVPYADPSTKVVDNLSVTEVEPR